MSPPEHFVIGWATGNLAYAFISLRKKPKCTYLTIASAAAIGAVLPDMDSFFGHYGSLDPRIGHRGMTHSFAGIFVIGVFLSLGISSLSLFSRSITGYYHWLVSRLEKKYGRKSEFDYARYIILPMHRNVFLVLVLVSFLGGFSHLLADLPTPKGNWQGLPIFYPLSEKRFGDFNLIGWYDIWGFWTVTAGIAISLPIIFFAKLFNREFFRKIPALLYSAIIVVQLIVFHKLYSHIRDSRYSNENQWYVYQRYTVIKQLPEKIQVVTNKMVNVFVIIFKSVRK